MTERSMFWEGTVLGDCGPYTQTHLMDQFTRAITNGTGNRGVLFGWLNELEVTSSTNTTPVSVASGAAIVYGMFYHNDSSVSVSIPTPSAGFSRYDLIVVRRDWSAQTARIARVAGVAAAFPTVPSLTQTANTTYEVPLAQVFVDATGAVTITDTREFCQWTNNWPTLLAVGTEYFVLDCVTDDKIPDRTRSDIKEAGQLEPDSTNAPTWTAGAAYDYWSFADAVTDTVWVYFHFPPNMVGTTMDIYVWSVPNVNGAGAGAENCKWDYNAYRMSADGITSSTSGTINADQQARLNTTVYRDALIAAMPTVSANIVAMSLSRDGAADSYNSAMRLLGVEVSYTINA